MASFVTNPNCPGGTSEPWATPGAAKAAGAAVMVRTAAASRARRRILPLRRVGDRRSTLGPRRSPRNSLAGGPAKNPRVASGRRSADVRSEPVRDDVHPRGGLELVVRAVGPGRL